MWISLTRVTAWFCSNLCCKSPKTPSYSIRYPLSAIRYPLPMLSLGLISYGSAALGFLLLTLLLATSWEGRAQGIRLIGACLVTTLWAALLALGGSQYAVVSVPLVLLAEFLRYG